MSQNFESFLSSSITIIPHGITNSSEECYFSTAQTLQTTSDNSFNANPLPHHEARPATSDSWFLVDPYQLPQEIFQNYSLGKPTPQSKSLRYFKSCQ